MLMTLNVYISTDTQRVSEELKEIIFTAPTSISSQSKNELFYPRHPQRDIVRLRPFRQQFDMNRQRGWPVPGLHSSRQDNELVQDGF